MDLNQLTKKELVEYGKSIGLSLNINDKKVLQISCVATSEPIFMQEDKFYVRTNPATDSLTGKKQYEYIENRKKVFVSVLKDNQ